MKNLGFKIYLANFWFVSSSFASFIPRKLLPARTFWQNASTYFNCLAPRDCHSLGDWLPDCRSVCLSLTESGSISGYFYYLRFFIWDSATCSLLRFRLNQRQFLHLHLHDGDTSFSLSIFFFLLGFLGKRIYIVHLYLGIYLCIWWMSVLHFIRTATAWSTECKFLEAKFICDLQFAICMDRPSERPALLSSFTCIPPQWDFVGNSSSFRCGSSWNALRYAAATLQHRCSALAFGLFSIRPPLC